MNLFNRWSVIGVALFCLSVAGGSNQVERAAGARKPTARAVVVIEPGDIAGETPMDAICGVRSMINAAVRRQRSAHFRLKALPATDPNRARNALVNREIRKFCDERKYFWIGEGGEEAPMNVLSISRVTAANNRWTNGVFGVRWWLSRVAAGRAAVARAEGDLDLVMLGDSITHFWELKCPESWTSFTNGLRVANFGCAGDKVANAIWMAENGALDGLRTKAVSILIGTNDNSSDRSDPEEVARRIEHLVGLVRAKQPDAKILLFAIFPRGRSANDARHIAARKRNEATNVRLSAFAATVKNLSYFDLSASYLGPDGFVPKALMADGIHPTAEGYAIWAEPLHRELQQTKGDTRK